MLTESELLIYTPVSIIPGLPPSTPTCLCTLTTGGRGALLSIWMFGVEQLIRRVAKIKRPIRKKLDCRFFMASPLQYIFIYSKGYGIRSINPPCKYIREPLPRQSD